MPTFKFNAVYSSVSDNLGYIADAEKQIPESEVLKVMAYVNGEHAETMYAKGYHCSSNPVLAAEEFMSDREKYFACHKGKRLSGQGEGKKEILAHHIYVSCHEEDVVTPELLMKIADDFISRLHLENFRIFVSPHLNTSHKHFHMSICAYSMDGKRKFHMKNDTRYRCEMELNRIAVGYGLSIIDDQKLRKWAAYHVPEYVQWLDTVKNNGNIMVRDNISVEEKISRAEERRERNADRSKSRNRKEKPTEKQIRSAVRENTYKDVYASREYYTAGGLFPNVRKTNRPYRVRLYTETGRRRGTLELLFLLVVTAFVDTEKFARENKYYRPATKPAKEIQKMLDNIHRAQVYNVTNQQDLKNKIAEVGSWIGSHKKAMVYIERKLEKGYDESLQKAWQRHKDQYDLYRRQYRDLMLVKEAMQEVIRDQYRYQIYDFEPTEERENESKQKASLDDLISSARKSCSMQTDAVKQEIIER